MNDILMQYQAAGAPLAVLSALGCGWVVVRCLRRRLQVSEPALCRTLGGLAAVGGLFSLGAALASIPAAFYAGELVVLCAGALLPVLWALLGFRAVVEGRDVSRRVRLVIGWGTTGSVLVIVYFLVSRPIFSEGAWFVKSYERWLFFVLLICGAWAMSYFERAFRWSATRLRRHMRWPRFWLSLVFGLWVLAMGEGFLRAQMHAFWLAPLALAQAGGVISLYRFLRVREREELPLTFTRRAAYTSAIAVILGAYLIFLGIVGKLIEWVGGDLETYLSVLAGFLAIALLSLLVVLPSVGRRVRRFIDRHLYKSRIDFASEWTRITDQISGILDLPTLVKTVAGFLREAFSDQVYVFLPTPGDGRLGLYYPFGHEFKSTISMTGESADWLWRFGEPAFLTDWTAQGEGAEERQFIAELEHTLGGRTVVPLLARRRFLGFAVLGKRRGRSEYDGQDFEFLSAMAGPVAFAVLTGQVSEELLVKREMESFNRLSTFVVHDLKNSVSMLSMLLQNAEQHISDPEFQRTALKTVSDAVARMQHLIGRISAGKDRVRPESRPIDVNRTIEDLAAHARLGDNPKVAYCHAAGVIPPIIGDPLHVRQVLENLVLNALEAMPEGGSLEISTGVEHGPGEPWVRARVRDTGCGMTREFISTRLFKPFESTKKKGLGIGMYHVRQMVEADGGRIQLESEPDKGTTFEVFWRTQREA